MTMGIALVAFLAAKPAGLFPATINIHVQSHDFGRVPGNCFVELRPHRHSMAVL